MKKRPSALKFFSRTLAAVGSQNASIMVALPGTKFFCVSVSGASAFVTLGDGDEKLPLLARFGYAFDKKDSFTKFFLINEGASAVTVTGLVGTADVIGGAGQPVDSSQFIIGTVDDPNGVYTPADTQAFAAYLKEQAGPVVLWFWSVANQNWFAALS